MRHLPAVTHLSVMGVRVGVANFFFGSIDRYCETDTVQLKFIFSTNTIGASI